MERSQLAQHGQGMAVEGPQVILKDSLVSIVPDDNLGLWHAHDVLFHTEKKFLLLFPGALLIIFYIIVQCDFLHICGLIEDKNYNNS